MSNVAELLERESRTVDLEPGDFERLTRRRDRKRRNQRGAAGAPGIATGADGSEPETLSGPPLEEQLRDWTLFLDAETETLSDGLGGVWLREGAEEDPEEPLEGLGPGLDAPWDPSRFGGTWESTDVDGSSLLLGIRVSEDPSGGYEVLLLDGAEMCHSFFGPITSDG